jgi:hypothetical protein
VALTADQLQDMLRNLNRMGLEPERYRDASREQFGPVRESVYRLRIDVDEVRAEVAALSRRLEHMASEQLPPERQRRLPQSRVASSWPQPQPQSQVLPPAEWLPPDEYWADEQLVRCVAEDGFIPALTVRPLHPLGSA